MVDVADTVILGRWCEPEIEVECGRGELIVSPGGLEVQTGFGLSGAMNMKNEFDVDALGEHVQECCQKSLCWRGGEEEQKKSRRWRDGERGLRAANDVQWRRQA